MAYYRRRKPVVRRVRGVRRFKRRGMGARRVYRRRTVRRALPRPELKRCVMAALSDVNTTVGTPAGWSGSHPNTLPADLHRVIPGPDADQRTGRKIHAKQLLGRYIINRPPVNPTDPTDPPGPITSTNDYCDFACAIVKWKAPQGSSVVPLFTDIFDYLGSGYQARCIQPGITTVGYGGNIFEILKYKNIRLASTAQDPGKLTGTFAFNIRFKGQGMPIEYAASDTSGAAMVQNGIFLYMQPLFDAYVQGDYADAFVNGQSELVYTDC